MTEPSSIVTFDEVYYDFEEPIKDKTCQNGYSYPIEVEGFRIEEPVCYNGGIGGRVSLNLKNEWGTVCDDFTNKNFAKVFCHQMGLPHA